MQVHNQESALSFNGSVIPKAVRQSVVIEYRQSPPCGCPERCKRKPQWFTNSSIHKLHRENPHVNVWRSLPYATDVTPTH
ncbi:hypothetical protein BaRGS_00000598 [Batillaria attramentaria]|uniref:Uncharacterized protein n=1 Tax=Batillaria attramentaria TaxID=370345 RepID=A0ABD0MA47_9CAEN